VATGTQLKESEMLHNDRYYCHGEPTLDDILADPIIRLVMRADKVTPADVFGAIRSASLIPRLIKLQPIFLSPGMRSHGNQGYRLDPNETQDKETRSLQEGKVDQRELWAAAKLAVRAYARDPSERNAVNVDLAWEKLREHNSSAMWRRMRRKWLEQDTATGLQDWGTNGRAHFRQNEREVA
jgi:hypothetical protein